MNKICRYCRKPAVYWNSILKIIKCHACDNKPKAKSEDGKS